MSEELSREDLLQRYAKKARAAPTEGQRRSPFKFLDSYDVDDADIFFGRDSEIDELLRHFHSHGHVLVYGESGSGKSSLVECGLRGRIPAADALFISLRVHARGLSTVCGQIYREAGRALGVEAEAPPDATLAETLREVRDEASRPVVLFFDQFEELFIFHDAAKRRRFAEELAQIARARLNVKIIIGVRQDYLAHLSELEETVEGLFDNRFWLRRMSRENAAQAVVKACETCDVSIDADLAARVIHRLDPSGEGVELPYLQVVMDRLYRQAVGDDPETPEITAADVDRLGDIANILGSFLTEEVAKLPSPETGRQMLKAFVTREGTRRSLDRAALTREAAGFGAQIPPEVLDTHLEQLAGVRILREIADTGTFELRHDALAATVAGWISQVEKELIEVRDNLQNRFKEYEARGQPEDALLDRGFVEYLAVYMARLTPLLDGPLNRYIEKSQSRLSRRKRRKRAAIGSGVLALLVVGIVAGLLYVAGVEEQREIADARAEEARREKGRADRKAEEAGVLLYASLLQSALREWETNNIRASRELLDSCEPALRRWEHGYVNELFTGNHRTIDSSVGRVLVAFSPKGRRFVTYGESGVRLWDTQTYESVLTIPDTEEIEVLAISRDGSLLIGGGRRGPLKLWDARTGREKLTIPGAEDVTTLAFSPDGSRVLSGDRKSLKLWDTGSGEEILAFEDVRAITSAAFSPDGSRVASGSFELNLMGSGKNRSGLRLWDAGSGELIREITEDSTFSVAFSSDSAYLVSGSWNGTIGLWDGATGKYITSYRGHDAGVYSVAFNADGSLIVSGSEDKTIRLSGLSGEIEATFRGHTDEVYSAALSPDGRRLLSSSADETLRLWDVRIRNPMRLGSRADAVAFSSDSRTVAGASLLGNGINRHDTDSGREAEPGYDDYDYSFACVALGPDGRRIVKGSRDNTIRLWDPDRGEEPSALGGHEVPVHCLAFSPDGRWVVSGSEDRTLKLWDVETAAEIRSFEGHRGPVVSVGFSPDGRRIVSGSEDRTLMVWDTETGEEVLAFAGHESPVRAAAFSADGRWVVSGSEDGQLRLWDTTVGVGEIVLEGHGAAVTCVAFSHDGRRMLSGSEDGTLKLWDTATGVAVMPLRRLVTGREAGAALRCVAFSPNGRFIASGNEHGFFLWDAGKGQGR